MPQFDSLTTRMPEGVTNAAPWQTMGFSGIPDPSWAHVYHNDFDTFNAADWTITKTGTGTTALATADGGALLLTNTTGTSDSIYMQLVAGGFKMVPGKAAFFKFAGQLSNIGGCYFYAGFMTNPGSGPLGADGIYLIKAPGGALTLTTKVSSVPTTIALPASQAIAVATNFELGIAVDAQGNVAAYFNPTTGNNPISAAAAASSQARGRVAMLLTPTMPPGVMSPVFGLLNTAGLANTLTVDYITAVRER